jgi:hypothetical protein
MNAVGQSAVRLRPDVFVGVEFGGVGGKGMEVQPTLASKGAADQQTTMSERPVPQQHDVTAEMPQQFPDEGDHLFAADLGPVALEMHADPRSPGRERKAGDDRQLVVAVTVPQNWGAADWSPRLPHEGDKQEAALVQEDHVRAQSTGFFLLRAK